MPAAELEAQPLVGGAPHGAPDVAMRIRQCGLFENIRDRDPRGFYRKLGRSDVQRSDDDQHD